MASSSKGQRWGSWRTSGPYPQLMRPRFLDPLSPLGEISSLTLPSDWYVGHRVNAFHMSMTTGKSQTCCQMISSLKLAKSGCETKR